jgi:hypothetical protein
VYANAWSLGETHSGDSLVTSSADERDALLRLPGWREVCHSIAGPSVFCVNASIVDGRNGPFMLFNDSAAVPRAIQLYRCVTGGASRAHFLSTDPTCEGLGSKDRFIGYMADAPGGDTLRALRRCPGATPGTYTHALDLDCDVPQTVMGFVR